MSDIREKQAAMPDDVLIEKCRAWIHKLCETGGSAWSLRVPVDYEEDPDMLFGEICRRLEQRPKNEGIKG